MSDTSKMKSPLRWYHVLRISGELLNPLVLFLVILQLVVILLYWLFLMLIDILFWVAAYPLTVLAYIVSLPINLLTMLIVLGIKLFRFIKGQDRFGVLRCALNGYSRDYEGQCDE